jgi:hypothetical protein
MKKLASFIVLLLLSGCYCMANGKDNIDGISGYFSGCWNKVKHG